MSNLANIHSFESFGTVDGPGTRFVIFLQGCPLRCQYCHNPDSWQVGVGKQYSVQEVLDRYESIKNYTTGGITISGGEPLLQIDFVIAFAKKAHEQGIHICLDTSGITFNPESEVSIKKHLQLLDYIDIFLLDIKAINPSLHKLITGADNQNILAFARFLSDHDKPTWIRHVVIPDLTYNDKNLFQIGQFIATLKNVEKIELLPFHQMGSVKYESMGLDYPLKDVEPLNTQQLQRAEKIVQYAYKVTKEQTLS